MNSISKKITKQVEITHSEWVEELAQRWEAEAKERDLMDKLGRHAGDAQYAEGIRWCIEQLRRVRPKTRTPMEMEMKPAS